MKKRIYSFLIVIIMLNSCFSICDNEIEKSYSSPDGKYKIVIFGRNCGATTGYNVQISVIKASAALRNQPGNIFIAKNRKYIDVVWENDHRIKIMSDYQEDEIFKQKNKFMGIEIAYLSSRSAR